MFSNVEDFVKELKKYPLISRSIRYKDSFNSYLNRETILSFAYEDKYCLRFFDLGKSGLIDSVFHKPRNPKITIAFQEDGFTIHHSFHDEVYRFVKERYISPGKIILSHNAYQELLDNYVLSNDYLFNHLINCSKNGNFCLSSKIELTDGSQLRIWTVENQTIFGTCEEFPYE